MDVKRIVKKIYSFDLKNCSLENGNEMIETSKGNEFVMNFRKRDMDAGIIVTPGHYTKGLVYRSSNGGEIYNNPEWLPDIVNFSLNIFGLKKGAFYRLSVKGRNVRQYNKILDISDDRHLEVSKGGSEIIIDYDFSKDMENKTVSSLFRANGNEETLFFSIGKIFINNIEIEEVEILQESQEEEIQRDEEEGSTEFDALGVFSMFPDMNMKGRYIPLDRLTGFGINLYFDQLEKNYVLERDNTNDTISAPFTNVNYIVNINKNKLPSKNIFKNFIISEVSNEPSPNTLKQGYIRMELIDDNGNPVKYANELGRLGIFIRKIY